MRTAGLLIEMAKEFPTAAERVLAVRPLVGLAAGGHEPGLEAALAKQEREIRKKDRDLAAFEEGIGIPQA